MNFRSMAGQVLAAVGMVAASSAAAGAEAGGRKGLADSVPPDPVVPVLRQDGLWANGAVGFRWEAPTDPAPSSGIASLEVELRRNDPDSTATLMVVPIPADDRETSLSLAMGVKGGNFVLGMRAIDSASNVGPQTFTGPFPINARPLAPVLYVRPRYTASETIKPPLDASVDPDGHPIYAYYFRFTRLDPEPAVKHEVLQLPPDAHAPGEVWQVDGYGVDAFGGRSWPSATHTFRVVDSPPTDAPVLTALDPPGQAVNVPQASFRTWGESASEENFIQMSSDAAFSAPQEETWYNGSTATWDFGDAPDGHYTIHHRLRAAYGTGDPIMSRVTLDRVAPNPPEPIIRYVGTERGDVTLGWRLPTDPDPGSGVARLDATLYRADGGTSAALATEWSTSDNGALLVQIPPGVIGGEFRAELTATDGAGNTSAPAPTEPFTLNGRPSAAVITLPARIPRGEYVVPMVSGSVDPDGDPVSYRYRFLQFPPYTPVLISREYMTPAETLGVAEVWQFLVTAVDSHGAETTSAVFFSFIPGTPSMPMVRIEPAAPRPGDSLRVVFEREATDPDGDPVKYHYRWYRSTRIDSDGAEVTELSDLTRVPGEMVREGEFWRVYCTSYQEASLPGGEPEEVRGGSGWDLVRVSATNTPPRLSVGPPTVITPGNRVRLRVGWAVSDDQGDATTVEIHVFAADQADLGSPLLQTDGAAGSAEFDAWLAPAQPNYVLLIARDSQGAITQRTSIVIPGTGAAPTGWVAN